jgi:hypothetical protein
MSQPSTPTPFAPLLSCEITTETVVATDGHEEHPESMRPRVFLTVVQNDSRGDIFYARHYEVLATGYVIPWQTLPEGKFDYLHFSVPTLKAFRLAHASNPSTAFWNGTLRRVYESVGPSIPTLEMK